MGRTDNPLGDDRISRAFDHAPRLPIDNRSKIVIMSDCHRGTGDHSDNFAGNQNTYFAALRQYYDEGFTYIELGDGDELWENGNFEYITDEHSHVFWLLSRFYRDGRLHMLYGNHDMVKRRKKWREQNLSAYWDEQKKSYVPLFGGMDVPEGLILAHRESGRSLYLLHGHQADFFNDQLWRLSRFLVRHLWRPLELVGVKDPTSTAENRARKDKVEVKLMDWAQQRDVLLLAGHTHRPVFPQRGEPLYVNDGSCVHPRCITALEIENGALALAKWSVAPRQDRSLFIHREYLEGPVPLEQFFTAGGGG